MRVAVVLSLLAIIPRYPLLGLVMFVVVVGQPSLSNVNTWSLRVLLSS